jgi:adenylate cyclase
MNLHRYAEALSMLRRSRARVYRYVALIAGCHARLGDMESAGAAVAECLSMKPDFSITQFMRRMPLKIATDAEQLASSLLLAGLPD